MAAAEVGRARRLRRRSLHQPHQSVNHVLHPAEGPQLLAAAVDRNVAVLQRRHDHLHHHALVHQVGAAAVGVEDARDACVDPEFVLVGAVQGLAGPFAFGEDAVRRVAVCCFDRGVAVSRAVDVSGGCVEDAGVLRTGRVEGVYRPQHADLERLDGQRLVVAHARGRREVVNLVAADAESVDDVVADVPEFRVRRHVAQQRRAGGIAYVHAEDFVPVVQQTQTQVGADESHAAQYDYSFLHFLSFLRKGKQFLFHKKNNPAGNASLPLACRNRMPSFGVPRPLFDEQGFRELIDAVYRDDLDAFGAFAAFGQVSRHDDAPESQPCGLADALFGAGCGAHFA